MTTGLPDNDGRSAAQVGVTNHASRVTSGTVQSASAPRGNQNGEGPRPPEQSAPHPPAAEGPQSAEPGPSQGTGPNLENGQQAAPNRRTRRRARRQCKKNTKAAIRVASLNIRGYRSADREAGSKWFHVNQLVREKRIGILVVQETHLTEERKNEIESLFSNRLKIHISMDPVNPRARGGVAIVLNRSLTNVSGARVTEIVPGRALLIQTNWHKAEMISVLAVYAPNVTSTDADENAVFWRTIKDFLINHPNIKVDLMAGDFNMVEDMIDRLPMRLDPATATDALERLKEKLNLTDGWRATHPTRKAYTLLHSSDSQSRIDRIYVTGKVLETARDWKIEPTGIPNTDHSMVSVQVAHEAAPNVGKGRWSIPAHILRDKEFRKFAHDSGIEALKKLDAIKDVPRHADRNAQRIYNSWKNGALRKARERDKEIIPKIQSKMRELEKTLERINNNTAQTEEEHTKASAEVTQKLQILERQRHQNSRTQAAVRNRIEGETICRYWTQSNKATKPRDMMYALKKDPPLPGPLENNENNPPPLPPPPLHTVPPDPQYEKDSKRMAEMGRKYHNDLQSKCRNVDPEVRREKTEQVLEGIKMTTSDEQKQTLSANVTREEVLEALVKSQNNTAAGLDGATYELWKTLHNRFIEDARHERPAFDVVRLMTAAFVDIQQNGVVTSTRFADGWMCPLYKKGERTEIANYRPITCLNTDYKVFTKTLASRLAKIAPSLIHPSQAGFIPGRRIADQTKLIRMIFHYAEATEQNGLIVALDQEKAYDKIDHAYLWQTLRKFEIPEEYIKTVQSLYESAETCIMVNGYLSSPWQVTRGVRQGDPLSCLLFDLAIEPLAASLRDSDLKGFEIPGSDEKLIANLFADDTTTFLSVDDEFDKLEALLENWCIASKAKFNVKKTEVIPIGNVEYRRSVHLTRKTKEDSMPIPGEIHIATEGEAVRILGAWFGNNVDAEEPWTRRLECMDRCLEQWEKSCPTIEGRRLIIQMMVGGMTQYLTQVQGMPKNIEKKLQKKVRDFIWHDKRAPVSEEILFSPIEDGGRALLDISARNQAVDIMWLKSYLSFGPERPLWAFVADELFALNIPRSEDNVDRQVRNNIFLQSWKSSTAKTTQPGWQTRVYPDLLRLQDTAEKYGLRPEGLIFSEEIIRSRPIWYHNNADRRIRLLNRGAASNCLRNNHGVRTVGDAEHLARKLDAPDHRPSEECECYTCLEAENEKGCMNPHGCFTKAKALLDTLPPKWDPREAAEDMQPEGEPEQEWTTFKKEMITKGTLAEVFRIFTSGEVSGELPDVAFNENPDHEVTVATDGSCMNNREENAVAGAGVFCDEAHPLNRCVRVPTEMLQSNQTAELLAMKEAVEATPIDMAINIELVSEYTIDQVTRLLKKNEDEGFIGVANADLIKTTIARLRQQKTATKMKWVKSNAGHRRNEGAKKLADQATQIDPPEDPNMGIDPTLKVSGAKLSKITQSLAYKAIRSKKLIKLKNREPRLRTLENLNQIKNQIESNFKKHPTTGNIWKAIRNKDLSRQSRYWLWMATHDAYMIGSHWLRPNYSQDFQERAFCEHDGQLETMQHILTECETPGQKEVWKEAKAMWELKAEGAWIDPTLGLILGAPLANFESENGKRQMGKARMYRILMIESAYLIWKIRCARVCEFENQPFSRQEIHNRWHKAMNDRLELDRLMTNPKYEKKAMSKKLVLDTWKGVLHKETQLPTDWTGETGVLVGMNPVPQRGEG